MENNNSLSGQVLVNGTDIYTSYGAFLTEDKPGDLENLKALLSPAAVKEQTGVNIDNEPGRKYSDNLDMQQDEREFTLYFALYAPTPEQWMTNYSAFLKLLRTGYDATHKGWLRMQVPALGLTMTVFFEAVSAFTPLTYLYRLNVQAAKFKVKFKEPKPSF